MCAITGTSGGTVQATAGAETPTSTSQQNKRQISENTSQASERSEKITTQPKLDPVAT